MTTMKLGIFGGVSATSDIDAIVDDVRTAHEQGFASYWLPQIFGWDAISVITVLGRETEGIELGTSVVPTYPRHPAMLAAQSITAQATCEGRFTLGIGLSHQMVIENMFGMSFDKPVRHMKEYLDVLMPLVNNQPVSASGETISANIALDIPNQQPVPVMVAALGPQMLKLAGARTQGTITWMTGPATIKDHTAPQLNAAADEAGNEGVRVACGLPVCVTDDVDGARERASKVFAVYGQLPSYRKMLDREGADGPADVAIIGSEDEVTTRVAALADAGVTDFAASEFGANDEERERTRAALRSLL